MVGLVKYSANTSWKHSSAPLDIVLRMGAVTKLLNTTLHANDCVVKLVLVTMMVPLMVLAVATLAAAALNAIARAMMVAATFADGDGGGHGGAVAYANGHDSDDDAAGYDNCGGDHDAGGGNAGDAASNLWAKSNSTL